MNVLATGSIENAVFHIANVLRVPVLVAAILALVLVLVEAGGLGIELWRRRGRSSRAVEAAARGARDAVTAGDRARAAQWLAPVASSAAMWVALQTVLSHVAPGREASTLMAKAIADFDLQSVRRLERTRMLVRAGPALGLMGTLIPLSPALSGLANGDVKQLTDNLRVAFSVTVLGLLIGAVAFSISLVRDRLYSQDVSDLETIAALLEIGQES
jgi:biopolymer transport protein ExbB/TolQ